MFDFYNNLNSFYGAVAERCTAQSCPTMTAGDQYVILKPRPDSLLIQFLRLVYTWVDSNHKHVKLPAASQFSYQSTCLKLTLNSLHRLCIHMGPKFTGRSNNIPNKVRVAISSFFPSNVQTYLPPTLKSLRAFIPGALSRHAAFKN